MLSPTLQVLRLHPLYRSPLVAQKNMQAAIAKPPVIGRNFPQSRPQGSVVWTPRMVTDGLAIDLDESARPRLAHASIADRPLLRQSALSKLFLFIVRTLPGA
jgi:hypothetical protein